MKAKDVEIGGTYKIKVGRNLAEVKIVRENPQGGWDAESVATGKAIRLKSPERLCGRVKSRSEQAAEIADGIMGDKAPAPRERCQRRGLSLIAAAAQVLQEEAVPLTCVEIVDLCDTKDLWSSPGGKTPHNTLYSAIIREIAKKREGSRFVKAERGKFAFQG